MITKEIDNVLQNQSYTYQFYLVNPVSTFSFTPYTSVTFSVGTCKLSEDSGSFVNTTNLPIEIGNGWYQIVLTASEIQGTNLILTINGNHAGSPVYDSVLFHVVSSLPTTINTNLPNVNSFSSFDNPTMQEVLSVIWQAMTLEASKKKWSFATFLQKWTF